MKIAIVRNGKAELIDCEAVLTDTNVFVCDEINVVWSQAYSDGVKHVLNTFLTNPLYNEEFEK